MILSYTLSVPLLIDNTVQHYHTDVINSITGSEGTHVFPALC